MSSGVGPRGTPQLGPRGELYYLPPAEAFVGPFQNGRAMATGVLMQLSAANALATQPITHGLYRIPVYARMLTNPPYFPGDIIIVSSTALTATVQTQNTVTNVAYCYIT